MKPVLLLPGSILLTAIFASSVFAQTGDARQHAERVDGHYNALRALKAEFIESYSGAGIERSESGILYLKKPGKMRWQYAEPRQKLFISDGKVAYFYVPGEAEARKAPLSKLDDLRSPLRYLLGKTKLTKEFEHLELLAGSPESGNLILRGKPRSMTDRLQQVELEINKQNQIVRIQIEGTDGAVTEFRFRNLSENPVLEDPLFRFSPPPGVQIIEGDELAQ